MRRLVFATVAAFLVLGAFGAGYRQYSTRKEADRVRALEDQQVAETRARLDRVMLELKGFEEEIAAGQAELAAAKTNAERASAQAKIATAQENSKKARATLMSITGIHESFPRRDGIVPPCKCQAGDPLCSCL